MEEPGARSIARRKRARSTRAQGIVSRGMIGYRHARLAIDDRDEWRAELVAGGENPPVRLALSKLHGGHHWFDQVSAATALRFAVLVGVSGQRS